MRQEIDHKKDELRCECGSLMARITEEGVEIKCRRCKRRVIIPLKIRDWERKIRLWRRKFK